MPHPRQIIRQTMTVLIQAGSTSAGDNVYDTRDLTLFTDNFPAISVYSLSERLEEDEQQTHGLRRRVMTIAVECYHTGKDGAQMVDKLAWEVENILHANPTLNDLVEWCKLTDTALAFEDDGQQVIYGAFMTFEVTYLTHLYEVEGQTLVTVLYGFDPLTGLGNEPHYIALDEQPI